MNLKRIVVFLLLLSASISWSFGQSIQITSLSSKSVCVGTSLEVNFTSDGTWPEGTEFEIQLSDDKGSFAAAVSIGTGLSSPISGYVPWGAIQSDVYKLRLRAKSSNILSLESEAIEVKSRPEPPTGRTVYTMCIGDTPITLSAVGENLKWYRNPYEYSLNPPTPSTTEPISTGLLSPNYFVSQTVNGCESEKMSIVYANFLYAMTPVITNPEPVVCQNSVVNGSILSNSVGYYNTFDIFYWSEDATWNSAGSREVPIPNTSVAGTKDYYVAINRVKQCTSQKAKITLTVKPAPSAPQVANVNYKVRENAQPLTATGEPGARIIWYENATTDTMLTSAPVPSTEIAGTKRYYVTQLVNGCESARSELVVTVNECVKPPAPTGSSRYALCQGDQPVTLYASGENLKWYSSGFGSPSASPLSNAPRIVTGITFSLPTAYYVTQTIDGCESDPLIITVTIFPSAPAPVINNPAPVCQYGVVDESILTKAISDYLPGPIGYYWSEDNSGTGSTVIPTPSSSTPGTKDYYVAQNMSKTCTGAKAKITITVKPTPTRPTVHNINYLVGATSQSLTASGENGAVFKWYEVLSGGSPLTGVPVPSTRAAGVKSYFVSQTIGDCESERAELVVTVANCPKPASPTGKGAYSLCEGDPSVTLTATGENLKWYSPYPQNQLPNAPTVVTNYLVVPMVYNVTQTVNGCESDPMPIVVSVYRYAPKPEITNPLSVCQNGTISSEILRNSISNRASDPLFYWSNNNIANDPGETTVPVISTASPGSYDYYVSQSGYRACRSEKAKITVTVKLTPQAPVVRNVNYIVGAAASSLTADGVSGSTIRWYESVTGGSVLSSSPVPSTQVAGTKSYFVSQSLDGCESPRAELVVTVVSCVPPALPSLPLSVVEYCQYAISQPLVATGQGGSVVHWYGNNASGGVPVLEPSVPSTQHVGVYYYYVSQTINGCTSERAKIEVRINTTEKPGLTNQQVTYCENSEASPLSAQGVNLKWYIANDGNGVTTPIIPSTNQVGNRSYFVTQTGTNTCESQKAEIVVSVKPQPTATISGTTTIGLGKTAVLTVNFTGDAPWKIVLSNGVSTTTPNSSIQVLVTPVATTNYTITEVSNSCGTGKVAGNALVTVELPILETAVLTTSEECAGKSLQVSFTRSGDFPTTNTFVVQIAKESGVRTFYTVPSYLDGQQIRADLPDTLSGGNYYVRVVSRSPQGEVQVMGRVSPTILFVNGLPTATIAGDYRAYASERVVLEVKLTGKSPWTFNLRKGEVDSLISTSITPAQVSVLPKTSGTYRITSVFNQCGNGTASGVATVTLDPILGDNLVSGQGAMKIYPTVTESLCKIEVGAVLHRGAQIELFDMSGKLLLSQGIVQSTTELDLKLRPSGVYIVRVRNGNYRLVTRVIKL